jgi:hypothetical protein
MDLKAYIKGHVHSASNYMTADADVLFARGEAEESRQEMRDPSDI